MKNNKKIKELNEAFDSIKCSDKLDTKILEHLDRRHWRYKPVIVVISVLLLGTLTIGVVNAEEIAKQVYNFFVSTYNTDEKGTDITLKDSSIAEIKEDANFPECGYIDASRNEECTSKYTKQELETTLGIKLLSNTLYTDESYNLVYSVYNQGKIASLGFKLSEDITNDSKINEYSNLNIYRVQVSLNTKYAEEKDYELITGGTHEHETYHINNLDTDALIMKSAGQYTRVYHLTFVYNNVAYISEILFKGFSEQNPDDVAIKYLEAFINE